MIVDGSDVHAFSLQTIVYTINLLAIAKMKGEVGTGGLVARPEQGQPIPAFTRFQVTPIVGLPDKTHAEPLIKRHGPGHILNADGHMT